MIHVDLKVPDSNWSERVKKATTDLIESVEKGEKAKIDEKIWQDREFKKFLWELFNGKCAYCEMEIELEASHIDHYRPKGSIMQGKKSKDKKKIKDEKGKGMKHPGYYWLSYEISNLLISCPTCNTRKHDQFPIDGKRACKHDDDLEEEKPKLLNPYLDQPEKHIEFRSDKLGKLIKLGEISGKTDRGEATINICDLNREHLQVKRRKEWEKRKTEFWLRLMNESIEEIVNDKKMQYSAYLKTTFLNFAGKKFEEAKKVKKLSD